VGGTGGIDPFVALKGQLTKKKPVTLFTAQVTPGAGASKVAPFYSRENVLSQFIGSGWVVGSHGGPSGLDTGFDSSPGTPRPPDVVPFVAHISVKALVSNPPVFTMPTSVTGVDGSTGWDAQDQILVGSETQGGQNYTVDFAQPNPTQAELNAATDSDTDLAYWLDLPKINSYVTNLVASLTAADVTPYAKARAISNYFADPANHFQYSLSTPAGDSGNALVDFLKARTGYCQQYAAAMAVMLRLAGVPSRVVLGYTHAAPDSTNSFTVTTNDAHAWVEAYFSGIGWIPFDPTPLAGINGGASTDLAWAPHAGNKANAGSPTNGSGAPFVRVSKPQTTAPTGTGTLSTGHSGTSLAPVAVAAGVLLVGLALLASPWFARRRRRNNHLRRGRRGDTDALWAELSATATDIGYLWSDARSPRQVVDWLREPAGAAVGSLAALAEAVEVARYAPQGALESQGSPPNGRQLVDGFGEVRSALESGLSRRERIRASLLPASLGWTVRFGAQRRRAKRR
jgi:transglutaminase-like putative cysteine protease